MKEPQARYALRTALRSNKFSFALRRLRDALQPLLRKFAALLITGGSVCQSHQFRHVFFLLLFQFRQLIKPLSCHGAAAYGIAEQFSLRRRRTCLIHFCLCTPRHCGASVAVDATWKTQIRLAVLGFLQLVCDPAHSTRTLTVTEILSHAYRTHSLTQVSISFAVCCSTVCSEVVTAAFSLVRHILRALCQQRRFSQVSQHHNQEPNVRTVPASLPTALIGSVNASLSLRASFLS